MRGYAATGAHCSFSRTTSPIQAHIAGDQAALRAAAIAEGDSGAARTVSATTTREISDLAALASAISAGTPVSALVEQALESAKVTMDLLRSQVADLTRGPAATALAGRAVITRRESTINAVSIGRPGARRVSPA